MRKYLFALLACFTTVTCTPTEQAASSMEDLSQLFDSYKSFTYYTYPEYATYDGVHEYNDRLTDQSSESGEKYIDSISAFRKALLALDYAELTETDRLNYDLFLLTLDRKLDAYEFEISRYMTFNQQNGYHIYFPQIVESQPFNNDEDIDNYIERLSAFPKEVDNIIDFLNEGKEKGITQSCAVSVQVLDQLAEFAEMKTEESPLYGAVKKSEVLDARADELKELVDHSVTPAYRRLYTYYRDEYHGACREEVGIGHLEGGMEYYEYLVRQFTTTDLTPNEVFETGMEEVARIREEMIRVKAELGYDDMELTDFFVHLRTSTDYYFKSKEDLLTGYREILDNMDEKLPEMFGQLPRAPYGLKEMEAYRAKAAPAAYYYPVPSDGSRPGYFYVNTYDLNSRPKYSMTALALHEAVPGHHLQIALATEMENVPWFRNQLSVTAFTEGWALYAEYLGYESGMYDDALQKMGALSFEMWRACRLVVDVGLHYKKWTREEAVDFLKKQAPLTELDINSEVDRYISWPGQALAYKIGELKIKELRMRAEKELGESFDLRAFHDMVLGSGSIPLDLLEEKTDEWIAAH